MRDAVLTYAYQYGIGALVYLLSLSVLWRLGALGDDPRRRRWWVVILLLGLLLYAAGQGLLQFLGPRYELALGGSG
jgi:hypothetical protein